MQNEVKAILTAEDRGYTSTLQKAQGVTEGFGAKIKSGLGFGILMRAGQKCFDTIGSAITSNLSGAVKRFDVINNFTPVMQSLGFTADEAKASMDVLSNSLSHLPTTLDQATSQLQQIVAVTGDLPKATKLTLALNNAMASGGASAEQQAGAINQWVQAMSKGKPDLQDWRALVQTAPAQMKQLAESTLGAGKTQADLYDAMQSGEVTIDEVTDKMIELSEKGGDGFASWQEQAEKAGGGIGLAVGRIKSAIQRNLANTIDAVNKKFEEFGGVAGIITKVIPAIDGFGKSFNQLLSGDISLIEWMTQLTTGINGMLEQISAKAPEFTQKGIELLGQFITGIGQNIPTLINKGLELVLNIGMGIARALPKLIVRGLNAVTAFVDGLGKGNSKIAGKALTLMGTLIKGIIKAMPQILSAGLRLMVALLRGIVRGFTAIPGKVISMAKKIPHAIKTGVGNLAGIGRDIVAGLWNGLKARWDSMVSSLRAKASALPKAVKAVLGIGSPSKVFMALGEFTGEGFAIGINKSYRQVQTAMSGLYSMSPNGAMGGTLALNDAYSYNASARYEVVVPVNLNGREIARATAGDMQTALNQRQTRQNRKVGIR
jgi:tape measure domain-containing protein